MKKLLALLLVMVSMGTALIAPADARYYRGDYYNGGYGYHPYIQKALIGGGLGAVAGSLLGQRDPVGAGIKGAMLGSAAGLGYEYLRRGSYGGGYGGYGGGYRGYRSCGYGGGYGGYPGWGRGGGYYRHGHGHHHGGHGRGDWD